MRQCILNWENNCFLCRAEELQEPDPFVAVLQPEEALRSDLLSDIDAVFLEKCVRSRYCRAEVYPDWIPGTIAVPKKGMDGYLTIAYCLRMRSVALWDTAGVSQKIAQKIAETRKWKRPSAGQFFCDFLDPLTENDFCI